MLPQYEHLDNTAKCVYYCSVGMYIGRLAQLVEQDVYTIEVGGSSPPPPTQARPVCD